MSLGLSLIFGGLSSMLYLAWAACMWNTDQRHMTGALLFYAGANVFLMLPTIREFLAR